ncbi:hypothetical protein [Anaeromicrobium sediminis]|uniref:Uncharacterized protein n=1 Tax=Anaeromicrobium sediminis TaxID=1478221 RepID=A0A267MN75_9FIRM|nr:hypothetical protein [Anaeromicrobium sediminis]PAB60325.1 hypothetical protein CCE28_05365 [Anaeromicrobium sediminis]
MDTSKISSAFNIFHDGIISSIEKQQNDIIFSVHIPYLAEIINSRYKYFHLKLINCLEFFFRIWREENKEFNINEICKLELEISSAENNEQYVVIKCLVNNPDLVGGDLCIELQDLYIYDEKGIQISIEKLENISKKYWDEF